MSAAPAAPPAPALQPSISFHSAPGDSFDLVDLLLRQQQQLTAAEQFSHFHERHAEDDSRAADQSLDAADGAPSAWDPSAEPAQARYYRRLMPATAPSQDQQLAFEVDLDACSGCKACVVACHTLNGLEENESWRRVGTMTLGAPADSASVSAPAHPHAAASDGAGIQHVTTACHHCEDPGCLNGCPVKAYEKDPVTGIVRHLDDQCIGCKYCTLMCPYEVPKYSSRLGIVRKCDMCHNRLAVGEAPACVQSCPNEAIQIRIVDRATARRSGPDAPSQRDASNERGVVTQRGVSPARLAPGAPLSSITLPTTRYRSSRPDLLGVPQDEGIDAVAESHWPLAALLIATQISVGMLLGERVLAAGLSLSGTPMRGELTRWVTTAALLIGAAGLNVAPLHLGQPLRAWRVFLGLRTSWLSREAVLLGQYVGALSLTVGWMWLPAVSPWLADWVTESVSAWLPRWTGSFLLGVSVLLGVIGLYSSAMIYIATKRPIWGHTRTLVRFFGTSVLAGGAWSLAVALVLVAGAEDVPGAALPRTLAVGVVLISLATAAKLIWEWSIQLGPTRPADGPHDRRCRQLVRTRLNGLRTARLVAGALAVVAGGATAGLVIGDGPPLMIATLAVLAAVTLSVGESLERLLYFMSVVFDRMPGTLR